MMRLNFQSKLLLSYIALLATMGIFLVFALHHELDRELVRSVSDNLTGETRLAKLLAEQSIKDLHRDAPYVAAIISQHIKARVTVISPNGEVTGDSEVPSAKISQLENHSVRPEVSEALKGNIGSSIRMSATQQTRMLYLASPFGAESGPRGVIRLSLPLSTVDVAKNHMHRVVGIVIITAFVVAVLLSILLTRLTSRPLREMSEAAQRIGEGRYDQRLNVRGKDEIGQLAQVMNQMAERVDAQFSELNRLEQVRSDFVANVSHELRTPVTVIKGYAETLLDGTLGDDPRKARIFVEKIEKNANRLSSLITDLLALSELESAGFKFEVSDIHLPLIAQHVCELLEQKAATRGITIKNNLSKNLPLLPANRQRIEQVIFNLLDNAITYTREGSTVILSAEAGATTVTTKISDTGVGIPPHHLPRIFERFYRVDPARSRDEGGTGLGLSIVKHIVQLHGGSVGARSEQGLGSTFWFTLPRV